MNLQEKKDTSQSEQYVPSQEEELEEDEEVETGNENPDLDPAQAQEAIVQQPRSRARRSNGKSKRASSHHDPQEELRIDLHHAVGNTIHIPTLEVLNLMNDVKSLIENIGWKCFFDINVPSFDSLMREFYSTFSFDPPKNYGLNTEDVLRFKMKNKHHRFSINDFNEDLDFITEEQFEDLVYLDSICDYPDDFDAKEAYKELTINTDIQFDPSKSKANLITNPTFHYLHRILAYSFFGRKDNATILSKAKLFLLWAMVHERRVNLGNWLITQFDIVQIKKRV